MFQRLYEYVVKLEDENKRYRKALEAIANEDTYVATASQIAIMALEGSE